MNFKNCVYDIFGLDRLDEMLFILFEYHANTERMEIPNDITKLYELA